MELETPRLRLRMFEERDLDAYARMCANPEVMQFLGGRPLDRADTWRQIATYLGHWQMRGFGLFATELKDSGTFIGRIGLWYPHGWPALEIGWAVDRPYWGNGYATEAGAAVVRWAFEELDLPRLASLIHPDNTVSIRVAEKLGGSRGESIELAGAPTWIYTIDRRHWERQRPQ